MAVVGKFGCITNKLLLRNTPFLYRARCSASKFQDALKPKELKEWMPGPYPTTEEERLAAAKKYNLHPSEYKPIKPDDVSFDYPDLPKISAEAKDPYYPYDMPALKRNYKEPMHINQEILGEDRLTYGVRYRVPLEKASFIFVLLCVGIMVVGMSSPKIGPSVLAKQYPTDGVHYTFERAK